MSDFPSSLKRMARPSALRSEYFVPTCTTLTGEADCAGIASKKLAEINAKTDGQTTLRWSMSSLSMHTWKVPNQGRSAAAQFSLVRHTRREEKRSDRQLHRSGMSRRHAVETYRLS